MACFAVIWRTRPGETHYAERTCVTLLESYAESAPLGVPAAHAANVGNQGGT